LSIEKKSKLPLDSLGALVNKYRWYLAGYLAFLIGGFYIYIQFDRLELILSINEYHNQWLDTIMYYTTSMGNGWVFVGLILISLLFKIRYGFVALFTLLSHGLIVQFLKKIVFSEVRRPLYYLEAFDLHFVEGVKVHTNYSFPSGHTATVFAFFTTVLLISKNPRLSLPLLFIAIAGGFSRIYLIQHFVEDVLVGSLIGVVSAFLCYYWICESGKAPFEKKAWMDKPLIKLR